MKSAIVKTKLCSHESATSEHRRAFLKTSISLSLAGVTYSALSSITLANSILSSNSNKESNLLKSCTVSYNGYFYDEAVMAYRLGKRYYSPSRKSFNTPDPFSPFGVAGPNRFQYADGNPINNIDPTGHLSNGQIALISTIAALTTLASVVTFGGAAIALAGTITAGAIISASLLMTSAITGIASGAASIASIVVEEYNPELSTQLNIAGMALGVMSMVTGIAGFAGGLNTAATSGAFTGIFGTATRTSIASRPGISQMVNSARNVTMAGGISEGVAALSQLVIGYMAKNGTTLLKLTGGVIASGTTITAANSLRRHHNQNLNTQRLLQNKMAHEKIVNKMP